MVANFLRLKLTLMANSFRRSVWQTIGFILGSLYGIGVIVFLSGSMIALGSVDIELAGTILILVGTLAMLAWWVGPLFVFGVDATLDPQRFVLFPIPRRTLLLGLVVAGLTSIPAIVTVLAALAGSLGFWRDVPSLIAALVGGVLAVLLCIVGSRAWTTALSPLLESRRYREVVTVAGFVPLMLLGPAFAWGSMRLTELGGDLDAARQVGEQIAGVLAWTPLGAPWGLADAVGSGQWGLAAGRLVISLVSLAVVWVVWDRSLARSLVTPPAAGTEGQAKGLGWFGRFRATPTGAVAARCTTYWLRDPRYSGSVAVILLFPIIFYVVGQPIGTMNTLLLVGPLTGWILGYSISADIAYDNSAFALHVVTGVTGRADRWGRAIPVLALGGLVVLVFTVASVWVAGRWDLLAAMLGASLGLLLISTGISSAVSARLIYPVPKPGESPFKQPQGAAMATMISQLVAMTLMMVLALPVLGLTITAVLTGEAWASWATLAAGLGFGVLFLVLGVRWGARLLDRKAPDLLQKVMAFA